VLPDIIAGWAGRRFCRHRAAILALTLIGYFFAAVVRTVLALVNVAGCCSVYSGWRELTLPSCYEIIHRRLRLSIMAALTALPGARLVLHPAAEIPGGHHGNLGAHIDTLAKARVYVALDEPSLASSRRPRCPAPPLARRLPPPTWLRCRNHRASAGGS